MEYLWEQGIQSTHYPHLDGDISTDVLVIGGGMAGVLCARQLAKAGADCVLVEAKRIGSGVTKGTTAVLTAQHDTLYTDLISSFGREKAKLYLDANLRAVERYQALSRDIPCAFEERPSVMYSLTDAETLRKEAAAVNSLGFPAEFVAEVPIPLKVAGAVRYPDMAQFHPLKLLHGAARGLKIYEHTFVHRLEGAVAYTDRGRVTAKNVIVATHFPFINKHGMYFMKLYQKRSFVLALQNAPALNCTLVDMAEGGMYFRSYQNLLLVGGGDHRTGQKNGGFDAVRAFVRQYYPQAREAISWATQDCMSLDGVPYIGPYSPSLPNVFVASGFNEWGMTTSMVASDILSDLVQGRENRFAPVFSPSRSMLHTQLFANLGATAVNFCIPTVKRCPHLGCALRWNPAEHSWDCSCHGSRFDGSGALIDNPALRNASVGRKGDNM